MSLINDAIKRAERAGPPVPMHRGPELLPVDRSQKRRESRGTGLLITGLVALVFLLGGFTIWQVAAARSKVPAGQEVRANTAVHPTPIEEPQPPAPVQAQPPAPAPAPAQIQAPPAAEPVAPSAPAVQPAQRGEPSELRLQSIVFSRRPSAMISGQIVAPGEKLLDYTVERITHKQVLLSRDGQEIILTLR